MPAVSAARAITPSSASISRTRWPLPKPPIAGLQDISPIVAKRWVTSAVVAPERAAAAAASHPAWPPPMTTTSNFILVSTLLERGAPSSGPAGHLLPEGEGKRRLFHVKHGQTRLISQHTAVQISLREPLQCQSARQCDPSPPPRAENPRRSIPAPPRPA